MCVATVAVVTAATATVAGGAMTAAQQMSQGSGGGGSFTDKQLKGFAPTKGLQSYAARLLAENATTQRPTLQDFAASGGQARFPIKDPGFTPGEAADLSMIDPHTGLPMPFFQTGQTQLTPAQQIFLGQQRNRAGATGPLARYGAAARQDQRLRTQMQTAGPAQAALLSGKLGKVTAREQNLQNILKGG